MLQFLANRFESYFTFKKSQLAEKTIEAQDSGQPYIESNKIN